MYLKIEKQTYSQMNITLFLKHQIIRMDQFKGIYYQIITGRLKCLKHMLQKDIDCYTDLYFFSYLEDKYQEYNNNSVVSRRLTP